MPTQRQVEKVTGILTAVVLFLGIAGPLVALAWLGGWIG